MVDGLLQNKTLKRMKLRLNPIGYKYQAEIETLLALNNKNQQKQFMPKMETQIRDLQQYEDKKESVFEELERRKEELAQKKKENARAQIEANKVKAEEAAQSQKIEAIHEEALNRFGKLENENYNLIKAYNEQKQAHNLALISEQKRLEKLDKEIKELIEKKEELQREFGIKEAEDARKIDDLKLEIAKEKRLIEEDLNKLLAYENQYNIQLRQGKEEEPSEKAQSPEVQQPTGDVKTDAPVQETANTKDGKGKKKDDKKKDIKKADDKKKDDKKIDVKKNEVKKDDKKVDIKKTNDKKPASPPKKNR